MSMYNQMKTIYRVVFLVSFGVIISFLLASCTIEGKGDDGKDGMLATNTAIFDQTPDMWNGNINGFKTVLLIPEITEDILYNGAVLVYRMLETDERSIYALPYTYVENATTRYMDFEAFNGKVFIYKRDVLNGENASVPPSTTMTFKVVVIRGVPFSSINMEINIADYSAVAGYLGIK
jgi:predicted small secreted protein